MAKAIADRDSGLVHDSGRKTVGEYLDGWLRAIRGTLRERMWRRHEEIARIHLKPSLRHPAPDQGRPPQDREMLGHSSITITLDLYSHVLPEMQREAVSAMEDLLE